MSPISIDHLIGLKAIEDEKTFEAIQGQLIGYLGTTLKTFKRLMGPDGGKCRFTAKTAIKMGEFFQCGIDELLNPVYWEDQEQEREIMRLMKP